MPRPPLVPTQQVGPDPFTHSSLTWEPTALLRPSQNLAFHFKASRPHLSLEENE